MGGQYSKDLSISDINSIIFTFIFSVQLSQARILLHGHD